MTEGERKKAEMIRQVWHLVVRSQIRPEMTPAEWLKVIVFLHKKGWLYIIEKEDNVAAAVGAYRIKEFIEEKKNDIPEAEEGNILYCNFIVSIGEDRMMVKKAVTSFFEENKDIKAVIFEDKNNRIRIYNREEKENGNGKRQDEPTRDAAVVSRPEA